jgi:uroporphyrinogen decarboxylase
MADMTPRERVLAAINHQEPDRVPLDIGGGSSTSIVVEGYERLKRHWGLPAPTRILNEIFRVAHLDEEAMIRLGSDCRPLTGKAFANWSPRPSEPGTFVDIWGVKWKQAIYGDGCRYWELARNPLAEATIEDLARYPWPDPCDPGYTAGLAEEARALHNNTDYAIMADGGFKSFWEQGYFLRGFERLLMDLVENPEFVCALMEKLLEINMAFTGRFLDAVGRYIHVFRTADDLATQRGLLVSLGLYRRVLKPVYRRYFDFVRARTDAKIFYHTCGNATALIDDLVDIGVDIINPVQVSAMGDTHALKARFGSKIVFWGGIDTQHVLPHGSVAEVEKEVRTRIKDLGLGGGFVAAPVHNIQPDVPPENILAMAEATRRFGRYPLSG